MNRFLTAAIAAAAITVPVSAQTVDLAISGPATAAPGDTVTVSVTAIVSGLASGGAIGGYGLDLDITSGTSNVSNISAATSGPVFDLGVLAGSTTASSIERAVGGQLPNISNLNPGVDTSTSLLLFTADITIDPAATAGSVTIDADVPGALAGGIVLFPDANAGASIRVPSDAGTSLTTSPLVISIDLAIPCPGDANGDDAVTPLDISAVLSAFGDSGLAPFTGGDVTGDGNVTPLDISEVLSNFGTNCG